MGIAAPFLQGAGAPTVNDHLRQKGLLKLVNDLLVFNTYWLKCSFRSN